MKRRSSVILIKFGGSLITDKSGHEAVRSGVLRRLAGELRQLTESFAGSIVLGHGSGSFGHAAAAASGWSSSGTKPSWETMARTQDAAARLHREVITALLEAGLAPFSVSPGSLMVSSNGRVQSLNVEPLVEAIGTGLVPVLFGDVILDSANRARVFSTERVFLSIAPELLAKGFGVSAAYWLGNTDGVLDTAGTTIERITKTNAQVVLESLTKIASVKGAGGQSRVSDVTGGMIHRVESALALGRLGVPSWILDGRSEGLLVRAVGGQEVLGTYIDPE
jgi:isopentenyl phosphate kinase